MKSVVSDKYRYSVRRCCSVLVVIMANGNSQGFFSTGTIRWYYDKAGAIFLLMAPSLYSNKTQKSIQAIL